MILQKIAMSQRFGQKKTALLSNADQLSVISLLLIDKSPLTPL
ncbi:MAG: hypothetical protein WB445_13460 [Acinetobacter sp.]